MGAWRPRFKLLRHWCLSGFDDSIPEGSVMTTNDSDLNRAAPAEGKGYGKPPPEHRFSKGKSGNPGGKRKVKRADEVLPQLPAESLHEMLMLEGQRLVRVKAGGRWVEIPMIQAAFREVGMRAAKGDRLAMTSMAKLMMESSAAADRAPRGRRRAPAPAPMEAPSPEDSPAVVAAEEYTQVWTRLLRAAEEQGLHVAAPVPHPDEVAIGRVRGIVQWPGARAGETLSLDGMARMHAELQSALPRRRAEVEAMAEGPDKAEAWCQWFAASDALDLIEYHLPSRYAGQIDPTEPTSAERLRDRSLRELAEFDRERFAREREAGAARAEDEARSEDAAMAPDNVVPIRAEVAIPAEAARAVPVAAVEPEPEPEAAPTPMPAPEVAEAEVYCGAWIDLLEAQSQMQFARYDPTPHPDEVTIDEAAGRVTYAADVPADKRATLASLRETLAAMQADARQFEIDVRWAEMSSTEHFVTIAKRKREEAVELCGMVEWWLDEG